MRDLTIVAEMACAHEGSVENVLKLIDAAGEANVDVIQFQFFQAKENAIPGNEGYKLWEDLEIPIESYGEIFQKSRDNDLEVWATVGDSVSAEEAFKYTPDMWRLHSSDINNIALLEFLCKTSIPIVLSVGGSTLEEIEYAIQYTIKLGGEIVALVHGFQGYPTPLEEVNLAFVGILKDKFDYVVGYQDHTSGDDPLGYIVPAMSLSYGARIIEKHFTLDRSKKGIDYHSSLNPDELLSFTKQIREVFSTIGSDDRSFGTLESTYRKNFKKGLVFHTNLDKGSIIQASHIKMVRDKNVVIYGDKTEDIVGKTLLEDVSENQAINWELLK